MQVRRVAIAAALTLAPVGFVIPASHAAGPQCDGLDATIVGMSSPEKLFGTEGDDVVVLGDGNDIFVGKGGNDVVCAGAGADVIYPGAGTDRVFGEDGDDRVYEGPGDDHLDGGAGEDSLQYTQYGGTGLRLDVRIGKATSSNGTDTFTHFQDYLGSPGSDTLIGSSRDERIWGNGGASDVIYGFGGNDQLSSTSTASFVDAGDGSDRVGVRSLKSRVLLGDGRDKLFINPNTGPGTFVGGTGVDGIYLSGAAGYEANLNQGFLEYNQASAERSTIAGFENVNGSEGPDRIVGNALSNYLHASNGDDVIYGLRGADHLTGGSGFDFGYGGDGADGCSEIEVRISC